MVHISIIALCYSVLYVYDLDILLYAKLGLSVVISYVSTSHR